MNYLMISLALVFCGAEWTMTTRLMEVVSQMSLLIMNWKLVMLIRVRFLENKSGCKCGTCCITSVLSIFLLDTFSGLKLSNFSNRSCPSLAMEMSKVTKNEVNSRMIPVTEAYSTYFLLIMVRCEACGCDITGTEDLN